MNDQQKAHRSAAAIIDTIEQKAATQTFGQNRWGRTHHTAWTSGGGIPAMIRAWAEYADTHYYRYESSIVEDGVLGPAWEGIADGMLTLLNGELRGLDGGTLDSMIRNVLDSEGASPDR